MWERGHGGAGKPRHSKGVGQCGAVVARGRLSARRATAALGGKQAARSGSSSALAQ